MAAPYAGKTATFYISRGTSTQYTGEAMTQVGTSLQYYIAERTKAWWDPNQPVVIKDNGSAITTGYIVDHAGGYVTLSQTPAGTVTADIYAIPMEKLGGGFGWSVSKKGQTGDVTVFPTLAGTLSAKSFIGLGLKEWTATLKRHWYYARASLTTSQTGSDNDLVWTWKASGSFGNNEKLAYSAGTPLEVVRAANTTTVTYVDNTTTAAALKAHVEADATLSALWDVQLKAGDAGTGTITDDFTATNLTGGRDSTEQIAQVATKVLCVFYLESSLATSARLEGVGIITDLNFNDPLESVIDADLSFQGTGALNYHAN